MVIQHETDTRGAPLRVALTGAHGGYGRTLLAQLKAVPGLTPAVLVDPDTAGVHTMLAELGLTGVAVVPGGSGVDWSEVDVLVEATGRVTAGVGYARAAIAAGCHVVMVSKEIETVAGVALAREAAAAGVRYLPGDGDQPANLIRLLAWVERVGLEVVALGKSSEYDLVFDPATGKLTQLDTTIDAPGMAELLELSENTLERRAELVAGLKRRAAADYCEMTVVSQYTGALPDTESLHYPVARPAELADVYAEREHGGLIGTPRSVDVFSALRLPGEASFAGGVFAVVRTNDPETWQLLAGKGHVVSRDGRYACIYWPYHLMGVETPLTILAAAHGPDPAPPARHAVLAGRTGRAFQAGDTFAVEGHHHEVAGIDPVIRPAEPGDTLPFYLLGGARLVRDVPAGHLLGFADVTGYDETAAALFHAAGEGR
ncbi:homoserine dehydrogenase [Amycolatopsis jiangsuensis]|uniref:Putative homoserine dehydrogenase-like protein n=1 Tax=Amycolatopsis jiangsuensis TaxID=1181879 RepID=A0A840ITH6_9PSEU|nr:homoserine dehydrogenase [Amycolatopsis jiangsuensis]MBB4685756.1 putative homoserine dehydrogenase-like protein [Amycolatopsis jiangsuensis]